MSNIEKIEHHLRNGFSITTMEAFKRYSICHLAKYIQLLKRVFIINDVWEKSGSGKRYKVYSFGGLK